MSGNGWGEGEMKSGLLGLVLGLVGAFCLFGALAAADGRSPYLLIVGFVFLATGLGLAGAGYNSYP